MLTTYSVLSCVVPHALNLKLHLFIFSCFLIVSSAYHEKHCSYKYCMALFHCVELKAQKCMISKHFESHDKFFIPCTIFCLGYFESFYQCSVHSSDFKGHNPSETTYPGLDMTYIDSQGSVNNHKAFALLQAGEKSIQDICLQSTIT